MIQAALLRAAVTPGPPTLPCTKISQIFSPFGPLMRMNDGPSSPPLSRRPSSTAFHGPGVGLRRHSWHAGADLARRLGRRRPHQRRQPGRQAGAGEAAIERQAVQRGAQLLRPVGEAAEYRQDAGGERIVAVGRGHDTTDGPKNSEPVSVDRVTRTRRAVSPILARRSSWRAGCSTEAGTFCFCEGAVRHTLDRPELLQGWEMEAGFNLWDRK